MKIKVNQAKETISIKGLTPLEFAVIESFMSHTRMGQEAYDGGASAVPFAFAQAIEEAADDLLELDIREVVLCAVPSEEVEGITIVLDAPTLEVYAD